MTGSEFEEIYAKHASMVYNLCLNYLQNLEDAEEVTQDVFVKVYASREQFEGKSAVKTWIYRIAINRCLDLIKSRSRLKRLGNVISIFETKAQPGHFEHPGVELEHKEAVANLMKLVDRLPEQQKTALMLKALEGLSLKEISAVMEKSEKSVESLLSRAKENLKKLLNPNEG